MRVDAESEIEKQKQLIDLLLLDSLDSIHYAMANLVSDWLSVSTDWCYAQLGPNRTLLLWTTNH